MRQNCVTQVKKTLNKPKFISAQLSVNVVAVAVIYTVIYAFALAATFATIVFLLLLLHLLL